MARRKADEHTVGQRALGVCTVPVLRHAVGELRTALLLSQDTQGPFEGSERHEQWDRVRLRATALL